MLEKTKFDYKVTAVMLVIVLFTMGVEFLLYKELYGFDILAHDGEMHNVVAFSCYMVDVGIALVDHGSCEGELV